MLFPTFYLRYVKSRGAIYGMSSFQYWLELFGHIAMGVLIFYLTETFAVSRFWIWTGRVFLGYAVLQAYVWIIWDPLQEWRRPIVEKNNDAVKRQYKAVLAALKDFYYFASRGSGNPARSAGSLMDALIVYHTLCRATDSSGFSRFHDDAEEIAKEYGVEPLVLELLGRDDPSVPTVFKISTVLPGGKKFKFEKRVVS